MKKNVKALILSFLATLAIGSLSACDFGGKEQSSSNEPTSESVDVGTSEQPSASEEPGTSEEDEEITVMLAETESIMRFASKQLTATIKGTQEQPTWTSSNTEVATVDANGLVSALSIGEAVITVSVGNVSASCTVTVTETDIPHEIELSLDEISVFEGKYSEYITVDVSFDGDIVEGDFEYAWSLVEGDEDVVNISASTNGKSVQFEGLKVGTVTFEVYTVARGYEVSKEITITVKENTYALGIAHENIVAVDNGYAVDLTLGNEATDNVTFGDAYLAINGAESDESVAVTWVWDSEYVNFADGTVTALKAGTTTLTGTATYNEKQLAVLLTVSINKGEVTLEETDTMETAATTTFTIPRSVEKGEVEKIYFGENVIFDKAAGLGSIDGATVTLYQDGMPAKDEDLGLGKELSIETNLVVYKMSVDLYTMIIDSVAELDAWQEVAAENAVKAGLCIAEQKGLAYNGYFVLGANIEYNKVWAPYKAYGDLWAVCYSNKAIWKNEAEFVAGAAGTEDQLIKGAIQEDWGKGAYGGFKGIFDGQGHYIDGLSTANGADYNAFIVTLGGGTLKNVSFINVTIGSNCNSVVDRGDGFIENVYIEVNEIQSGKADDKRTWGLIRGGNGPKHTITNTIIDYTDADLSNLEYVYLGGDITSEVLTGVYVLGVPESLKETVWNHEGVARHQIGVYETFAALFADEAATVVVNTWDGFWTVGEGYALPEAIKALNVGEFNLTNTEKGVPAGTAISLKTDKFFQYMAFSLKEEVAGVSVEGNVVTVSEEATVGATFTVVATSVLDGTAVERTFTIEKVLQKITAENVVDVDLGLYLDGTTVKVGEFAEIDLSEIYDTYLVGKSITVKYGDTIVYDGDIKGAIWSMPLDAFVASAHGADKLVFSFSTEEANGEITLPINLVQTEIELNRTNVASATALKDILLSNPYGTYVLTSNLSFGGAGLKGVENFYGTLDGNGYMITNTYIHHDALPTVGGANVYNPTFIMYNYGTIVNLGFKLDKLTQTTGGRPRGIVYTNYGEIANVYVDVTFVEKQVAIGDNGEVKDLTYHTTGALATVNEGTISNVLVSVHLGEGAAILEGTTAGVTHDNKGTIENAYVINNGIETVVAVQKGATDTCVTYGAWAELTEADLELLGKPWLKDGEVTYFGETVIHDATIREEIEDLILTNANKVATLNNSAFKLGTEWTVSVNGTEVSVVVEEEGKLAVAIDPALLGGGYKATIIVKGGAQELSYSNIVVPTYITTAEELKAIGVGGNRNNTQDIEGYYVLANDITFEHKDDYSDLVAAGYPKSGDYYFKGTFDGNGYALKNMRVSDGGIFGLMRGATVKNLKLENVYLTNNPPTGVSNQSGAYIAILAFAAPTSTFENINITVAAAPNAWSWKRDGLLVCTGSWGESTFRNITIDASYLPLNTLLGISHNNKNVYENVVIKAAEYVAIGYTADSYDAATKAQNKAAMMAEFPAGVTFQKVAYADVPNAIKASNAVSNVKYLSDNETALGFAAGTHVYEVTTTNMWNDRIVIPADESYDYVEFDVVFTKSVGYATAWPSPGSGTYGSFGIYTKGLVISSDGKTRTMQVYKANGDTFKAQSGDKFEANTKYTIRIGFNKGESIANFNFGTDTNQTYYITNSRFGNYDERVYVSGTGELISYYEGDVTALGFAAGTKVSAKEITVPWDHRVRVNTDVKYDYVDITFATDKVLPSLCIWTYGINGTILPGNYSGTATSIVPNTDSDPSKVAEARTIAVTDLAGNAVSTMEANTVYKLRIYLNDNTSSVAVSSFNGTAANPITFYFGAVSYGYEAR